MDLASIESALRSVGLISRGGFHPEPQDGVPPLPGARAVATVVLAGNVGNSMWEPFQRAKTHADNTDPLNSWTREVLTSVARACGAHALFPFEGPPYLPFQQWAQRAEPVAPSPIGLLIHPDYGLWHAYRGALAFAESIDLPPLVPRPRPCETCATRPCLSTCPVEALAPGRYDLRSCGKHIGSEAGSDCMQGGCLARRACPVGRSFMYPPQQMRFHMEAFLRNAVPADD